SYPPQYIILIMVVPCLTCTALDKHEYTINQAASLYEYHVTCSRGIATPDPMPKEGFTCEQYENKLAVLPRVRRSSCAIEIRRD
ncbi:MAG: hypothetical protein MJ014_05175, partial [Methanocorpusculum sp.]|nr:hypothetical protein [Methanocorpusculum sp.]